MHRRNLDRPTIPDRPFRLNCMAHAKRRDFVMIQIGRSFRPRRFRYGQYSIPSTASASAHLPTVPGLHRFALPATLAISLDRQADQFETVRQQALRTVPVSSNHFHLAAQFAERSHLGLRAGGALHVARAA